MNNTAFCGKRGDAIRSDCYIEISRNTTGKNNVTIRSKVEALYGDSLKEEIGELINAFGLESADVTVEDSGSLPFVIAARFECALKRLDPDEHRKAFPSYNQVKLHKPQFNRMRRSRLYLPGNEPKFFMNAGLHRPDAVILDLEDSVAPSEKDAARLIVRNALCSVDFYGAEKMVRINQLPLGLEDLEAVVPYGVEVILLPKCESREQVLTVAESIKQLREKHKVKNEVFIMPIIESALGIKNAYEIAVAHESICALTIGLEDYTADLGVQRTLDGRESYYARSIIVGAAKSAGIQAIDTVFSDVADMEGLRQSVLEAKSLGFEGKGVIHPRQIPEVHKAFAPTPEEIDKASKIAAAFEEATAKGLGVVSLGSKMIDPPVVKRALKTIESAKLNGLL
ncbi:MAG: HpcH/HpaI aldolase/citrate lyase family protein [Ignavibacteriales bacterium]|nr:HpcH/HpaI aldolase/citrate lyase family protein [Ignavibacteriales bacterium]